MVGFQQTSVTDVPISLFLVNLQPTEMSATHWLYNALQKQKNFHQACLLRRLAGGEKVEKMEVIVRPLIGLDHVSGVMIILRHCTVVSDVN